jgi:hypothetical protein
MGNSYIKQIGGDVNGSLPALAAQLNTFLAGEGPITLFDVAFFQLESARRGGGTLVLSYRKPAVVTYKAAIFTDSATLGTAEAQTNVFLQANPRRIPYFIRDLTPNQVRVTDPSTLLLIYADSLLSAGVIGASPVLILRAIAPIAPGAVGFANLVTSSGVDAPTGQVQARNVGQYVWKAGLDAYAHLEPTSDADYQAFPVGCNA